MSTEVVLSKNSIRHQQALDIPITLANPSSQSVSFRITKRRPKPSLRTQMRRESQGHPLNWRYNAANILSCHWSHVVLKMALESKLKCNSHHRSHIITRGRIIRWRFICRWTHFKSRCKIQSAVWTWGFLNTQQHNNYCKSMSNIQSSEISWWKLRTMKNEVKEMQPSQNREEWYENQMAKEEHRQQKKHL